jgi:hypothetical protein
VDEVAVGIDQRRVQPREPERDDQAARCGCPAAAPGVEAGGDEVQADRRAGDRPLSTRSLVAPTEAEAAPPTGAATAMIRVLRSDSDSGHNRRRAGYFTGNVALRAELPALSVSVYRPAGSSLPPCRRASSKDRLPALAVCETRAGRVLAHAFEPAHRTVYVIVAFAVSV